MKSSAVRRFLLVAVLLLGQLVFVTPAARADTYARINGAGSSWAANAISQWGSDIKKYGITVDYASVGSSGGRQQFLSQTVDFAASDIPFQQNPSDGSTPEHPVAGSYAYMPIVAGGTAFMYNLKIGGKIVTNLRLSGAVIAKIFTGKIKMWNDPAIKADNPGLTMPAKKVVPVIRSDGSGSSAQFALWMQAQQPSVWRGFTSATGAVSYWPSFSGAVGKSGDLGVAGYVAANYAEGAIGYVQYSYAINSGFPVAKMLNKAGYYTEPTPLNVAVSLTQAKINQNKDPAVYLTQDLSKVYTYTDKRVYPLSSYSYFILHTKESGDFKADQGKTLAAFSYYFECEGQQKVADLGYSPLPKNLVQASYAQIAKIPGAVVKSSDLSGCHNPTFSADGHNELADLAPQPPACDKQGSTQCNTGTGGKKDTSTKTSNTSTNTSTSTTGGTTTGTTGTGNTAGGANPSPSLSYDPATDQYVGAGGGGGSGDVNVAAVPVDLATTSGWGGTQTLMLIAALVALALVFAPGITALLVRRGNR